jgi:hypothetical protein
MAQHTIPVFIIGSGRSGTRAIFKLLSGDPSVEVHHEYVCAHVQPLAAKSFMGRASHQEVVDALRAWHGAAVYYSQASYWVDCSNKLSWIIEPLLEVFPRARFVHLTRDGRKVAGSFFNKLAPEIYDDESVAALTAWLKDSRLPEPPPEKKYWWNIPQPGQPFHGEFPSFDQFQRICYHWREVGRVIDEGFGAVPEAQRLTIKLEDITADRAALTRLLSFVGLEFREPLYEALQTPQNVFFPMDFVLTEEQLARFKALAGDTMSRLGYDIDSPMYEVKY